MTKEQIAQMSTADLEYAVASLEQNITKMKALNADELVNLALCKAELKQRKEHGNC